MEKATATLFLLIKISQAKEIIARHSTQYVTQYLNGLFLRLIAEKLINQTICFTGVKVEVS